MSIHQPVTEAREQSHEQEVTCYSDNLVTVRGEGFKGTIFQRKEVVAQTSGYSRGQAFKPDSWHKLHYAIKFV